MLLMLNQYLWNHCHVQHYTFSKCESTHTSQVNNVPRDISHQLKCLFTNTIHTAQSIEHTVQFTLNSRA